MISLNKFPIYSSVKNEPSNTVNGNNDTLIEPLLQDSGDPSTTSQIAMLDTTVRQCSSKEEDTKFEVFLKM